jgi:adenylosuccinate lyase
VNEKLTYENPLCTRYASSEMSYIFSQDKKFKTWRKFWFYLAQSEKELGINISDDQIKELENNIENINYEIANEQEKKVRHDVMAHIYAYGVQCPKAAGIIHLGATSCYVGDNTDIVIMDEAIKLIKKKVLKAIFLLSKFALKYKKLPTLAFTHFQPAQLTTVGKRATIWIQDLLIDLQNIEFRISNTALLGCKGAVGTQASFLNLFEGDIKKVEKLEELICKKAGYEKVVPISGQTYSRKIDYQVLSTLSGIAQTAHKFANDIRLLQGIKEVEEPFEELQVGSSAMPYKRNPMQCERICSLAKHVITNVQNAAFISSTQWLERTLDDSANRRISIPEAFLTSDAILNICINVLTGISVNENIIKKHINKEISFLATENILMNSVKSGGNRQKLHEKLRNYSMDNIKKIKNGKKNDLIEKILIDPDFKISREEINDMLLAEKFIGCAEFQVESFIKNCIKPLLKNGKSLSDIFIDIRV